MGPRRSKKMWTLEEEAAMIDGISKHGVGSWSTIKKDPEFNTALVHRTNVDLKDKWRNMKATKDVQEHIKKPNIHSNESVALTNEGSGKDVLIAPSEPPAIINDSSEDEGSDKLVSRFADFKLDGIINAMQPSGSRLKQEQLPHPDLRRISWGNKKTVTAYGKLSEVQREMEYDYADSESRQATFDAEMMRIWQMRPEDAAAAAEKIRTRQMSPEDAAAAAAAAAVEKAEAAIAEAEEAYKEAVEAERHAEELKAVAEELERKLEQRKARPAPKTGKRGRRRC